VTEEEARKVYLYPGGRRRFACGSDNDGFPTCMGDRSFCGYSPELDEAVCTNLARNE